MVKNVDMYSLPDFPGSNMSKHGRMSIPLTLEDNWDEIDFVVSITCYNVQHRSATLRKASEYSMTLLLDIMSPID